METRTRPKRKPPKTKRISQQERILNYLRSGNTLNQADAITLFGCYRLAAVVERLRRGGIMIENLSKRGEFAVYKFRTPGTLF